MCMIEGCDERASIWNEREQRARKPHKCCECGRQIEAGEVYVYLWAKSSDGPFTGRWCAHCDVAQKWLWENCSGSLLSGVIEDCREHVDEYSGEAACIPALARIVVGAGRKWRVRRGPRAGQLMPIPRMPGRLEPAVTTERREGSK